MRVRDDLRQHQHLAPSSPLGSIDLGGDQILDWSGQGRSFAFITFERSNGGSLIPVYEITDVQAPQHVHTFLAPIRMNRKAAFL